MSRIWMAVLLAFLLLPGCSGEGVPDSNDRPTTGTAEAADVGAESADGPEPTSDRWLLLEEDAGDGASRVELARNASRGANSSGIPPTLYLRCEDGTTDVYIVWYEDPEGRDNDVTTRTGSERAVRRTWSNVNGDASVFPRDSATVFVRRLMEADSLTVESNLYKRLPITAAFDLSGLSEAVTPLRDACDW